MTLRQQVSPHMRPEAEVAVNHIQRERQHSHV